mmetsp:Transcript_705/g.1303  ORF Transcript_705/g.1303 Transcript_705/m.1303 type:complete len:97 (+) Transcript_705:11-301(+)
MARMEAMGRQEQFVTSAVNLQRDEKELELFCKQNLAQIPLENPGTLGSQPAGIAAKNQIGQQREEQKRQQVDTEMNQPGSSALSDEDDEVRSNFAD